MIQLPAPQTQAPPSHSFWQDFRLLLGSELRLTRNKLRQRPPQIWLLIALIGFSFFGLLLYLGKLAYGALAAMPPAIGQSFLSFAFLAGLMCSMLFGVAGAFATLYMSPDLELLFVAPVATRAIFAVKTLKIAAGNLLGSLFFIFLPGLFFGLLLKAPFLYYLGLLLVTLGLLALGTALAELFNLLVMRIVPPHRSKEAVGFISAFSGIFIALVFQIPSLLVARGAELDLTSWLAGQGGLFRVMNWFPWGWGARALAASADGNQLTAAVWLALTLAVAAAVFAPAFLLVEKGFRRGWISLSQGEGARKRSRARKTPVANDAAGPVTAWLKDAPLASPTYGMWAVAKKDLLTIKRDTREWFSYLTPLLLMAFFIGRFLFFPGPGSQSSLTAIVVMYTIMFSGNMALQSFGREGESDWLLNSVPLAGWPVVGGKLLAAALPTLVLIELLLAGTAIAVGLAAASVIALAIGAALVSFSASAIGLYYSISNCRYNPENPQQRVTFGGALIMFLTNGLVTCLLAAGLALAFPPAGLVEFFRQLTAPPFARFPSWLVYYLSRPLFWPPFGRILTGLGVTLAIWLAVFWGFMAATVRKSSKGFRVELITSFKKTHRLFQ